MLKALHLPHRAQFGRHLCFAVMPFFARERLVPTAYHFCYLPSSSSHRETSQRDALPGQTQSKRQNRLKQSKQTYLHQAKEFQRKSCSVKLLGIAVALPRSPHTPTLALSPVFCSTLPSLLGQSVCFLSSQILLKSHLCDHTALGPSRCFEHRRGL